MLALILLAAIQAPEPLVSTRHHVTVGGRVLRYTATAGRLPILDNETGEVRAWMFSVSYVVDGGGPRRPVTFAWNGGPGSNAGLIQLGGLGPRRFTESGTLVDNQETWLDRTDLVFIDPVGTGFSRVTKREYAADFYQTKGDAESVAELIRVWRDRFGRPDAPIYLVGESFGVTRAARVAEVLERRRMAARGVVLIGLTLPLATVPAGIREAVIVPAFTAAAWYHHRPSGGRPADVGRAIGPATRFALDTLGPMLAAGDQAANRPELLRRLTPYIGVAPLPDDTSGIVPGLHRFARLLLADQGRRLGHYDTRFTAAMDRADQPYDPRDDPSLQGPPPPGGVVRYLRSELRYHNDLQYTGPFGGTYPPAERFRGDWMSQRWHWEPGELNDSVTVPSENLPLRKAMATNPELRVVAVCGYFDLICTPAANEWVRDALPDELRRRVFTAGYPGGHATYLDQSARARIKADAFRFFGWNP